MTQLKIGIIDETDCFSLLRQFTSIVERLQPQYLIAPNPTFYQQMLDFSISQDVIICHRKIWTDECDEEDECQRLSEFEKAIKPRPLLRVGKKHTNHQSCPNELLDVFTQLTDAHDRLGKLIGAEVKPVNKSWKTPYLTITALEIIGDNEVAATLQIPATGDKTKYYKLKELRKID